MEVLICPSCGYVATPKEFNCSQSDECWCPKCRVEFQAEEKNEDADD